MQHYTPSDVQKALLRPLVGEYKAARNKLNNAIIMAVGEEGWTLDLTTLECSKPEEATADVAD